MIDRVINKFWRSIFLPKSIIKILNTRFNVPRFQINNFYKSTFQSEKWMQDLLYAINKTKGINSFIDVGINIGQTLLKIKSINPNVAYIGFEPNPFCFSFVQQIISLNKLNNCKIIPCGLSDKSQLLKLAIDSNIDLFDSSSSLIEGFRDRESKEFQFVSVLQLDKIIKQLNIIKIDVVKIDIEGGELEAISGMVSTIKQYKPIIIVEVLPSYSIENEFRINRQKNLASILDQAFYKMFKIGFKEQKTTYTEVMEFPIHQNFNESDYLLIPNHINITSLGLEHNK